MLGKSSVNCVAAPGAPPYIAKLKWVSVTLSVSYMQHTAEEAHAWVVGQPKQIVTSLNPSFLPEARAFG